MTDKTKRTARTLGTPRDADRTRARFLSAVAAVLRNHGLQGLGVNAIARAANRDKALLYKYFGGLEGLYAAFALEYPLFPSVDEMLAPETVAVDTGRLASGLGPASTLPSTPRDLAKAAISGYLRHVRKRPLTLEILRWELVVSNPLTQALSKARSAATEEFNRRLQGASEMDIPALTSLIYGGLVYLLLKSGTVAEFNGMDLSREKTWIRLEAAAHRMVDSIFSRP